ncbi:hypothetical protein [Candidatus Thiodictyon syntrophicum]|jgi:hypothetical protein|uniref:hypothetical protein n=1 Tax=Candidatus Thiodictyon syntrophicum TaxID=1166950 RepID=UPI0012FE6273|nr:hypothetical protein [Candidatus Thiodictyon syntrophicum]
MKKRTERASFVVSVGSSKKSWLIDMQGDPGRTCVLSSARRWNSRSAAERAMFAAKSSYPSRTYEVQAMK